MKRFAWMIVLVLLMVQPVQATELPKEVQKTLPAEAEQMLDDVEKDTLGIPSLTDGLAQLWKKACSQLQEVIREELGNVVLLLGVVLLCALVEDCFQMAGGSFLPGIHTVAGGLGVILIAAGDLHSLMGIGTQAMETLNVFSKALLPTLSAAVAAGGGVVSAGVRHVAAVFLSDVLMTLIRHTLLPMVFLYTAMIAADLLLPGKRLLRVAAAVKKGITWLLTSVLALYTAYLSLAGIAAGSADGLSLQLTRSAMGTVPVVGNIISETAGVVLHGAAVMKSTVGIAGVLAVLAFCLTPFLHLAVHYVLYKLAAFFAGAFGPTGLVEVVEALGGAFGLLLGMTGACATLLLISIMSCVMVVTV